MADADVGGNFWGYLVNSNKTAAPLLEQLCLGLTRIISRLGKGPEDKLTPERMAAFYRSVGGHFDGLFLGSNEAGSNGSHFNSGLSFMYRTLGCFHSLEPTPNPYETPCVPCLTPAGFVRWQTIQLLLCPDEHAGYLQKAVQVYDVPRPDGRNFSKSIPRDAFPEKPDGEMEKWHKQITSQLNQDYMHRLKNSPYSSPLPQTGDRQDGYFGTQIPKIRTQSRGSKERHLDDERRRPNLESRRSSVPDNSATATPEYGRPPSSYQRRDSSRRSISAQRLGHNPRPRAATTGFTSHNRNSSSSSQRDEYDRPIQGPQRYPPPYSRHHSSSKYRATVDDGPSDGEASSEDSGSERRRRKYVSSPRDEFKKGNLQLPRLDVFSTKRRHSHDAGALRKNDRPRREEPRSSRNTPPENSSRLSRGVQFKEDVFRDDDDPLMSPVRSASSRRSETFPQSPVRNDAQYGYPMARETSSGSGSEMRNGQESYRRGSKSREVPLRVSTMTGVGGRRYANAESNGGTPTVPDTPQRDPRMRYSVIA